jgi:NADH-quinone oxidoreductase subunit C/D
MSQLEDLKADLTNRFPGNKFQYQNSYGNDVIIAPAEDILPLLRHLKSVAKFDFLLDVCGVDYPDRAKRFEVVYHLFSSRDGSRLRIRCPIGEGESIESATQVWNSANWFEREAYDLYGILFKGHPNLRRILTHHKFEGHALRKDYDPNYQQHCNTVLPIEFEDGTREPDLEENLVPLNIGPSHPATHGTLRIMAALDGEKVVKANVEIGFLHRCFEKMAETHPYNQVIPYTDRLNYCSAPINNVAYCKTVEKILGLQIPPRAQAIRVILMELSRIIDHIVCIGANAVDLGALTTFFHLFTFREMVYTLFEKLCGARLTVSLTRIGGMVQDPPPSWFNDVLDTCKAIRKGVDELDILLTGNKIWIQRTQNVGKMTSEQAIEWGITGPMLRATGLSLDLRKLTPYYGYDSLDFDVPVGTSGDVYDRYLVRVAEMRQSLRIIEQVAKNVPGGDYTARDKSAVLPEKKDVYGNIEGLMNHFMLVMHGLRPPVGEIYDSLEAANGELGFYLVSDGSAAPYRLKVRPPCFANYQNFSEQITGGLVADVIALVGSVNVIAGELDR